MATNNVFNDYSGFKAAFDDLIKGCFYIIQKNENGRLQYRLYKEEQFDAKTGKVVASEMAKPYAILEFNRKPEDPTGSHRLLLRNNEKNYTFENLSIPQEIKTAFQQLKDHFDGQLRDVEKLKNAINTVKGLFVNNESYVSLASTKELFEILRYGPDSGVRHVSDSSKGMKGYIPPYAFSRGGSFCAFTVDNKTYPVFNNNVSINFKYMFGEWFDKQLPRWQQLTKGLANQARLAREREERLLGRGDRG